MESDDLENSVDPNDSGAETLRRYRYQAQYAALKSLELMSEKTKIEYVYCEHHQDVLIKLENGKFIGVQVKTREIGQPLFRSTEDSVLDSIATFCRLDQQHPDNFSRFVFATNYGFVEKKDFYNLGFILSSARQDQPAPECLSALRKFIHKLKSRGITSDEVESTRILRKVVLEDKLPHFDDMQGELIRTVASLPKYESAVFQDLRQAAQSLEELTMAAGSRKLPRNHFAIFASNYYEQIEAQIIANKLIDRAAIMAILEMMPSRSASVSRTTSSITRQQLESNLSLFREELVSYQQFLSSHLTVKELRNWGTQYKPPYNVSPSNEFVKLVLKVDDLLQQIPRVLLEEMSTRGVFIHPAVIQGHSHQTVHGLINLGVSLDAYGTENAVRILQAARQILERDAWQLFRSLETGTPIPSTIPALGLLGEHRIHFRSLDSPTKEIGCIYMGLEHFGSVDSVVLSGMSGILCYGQRRITFWNPSDASAPRHQFELPSGDALAAAASYADPQHGCTTYVISRKNVFILNNLNLQSSHGYTEGGFIQLCALRSSRMFGTVSDGTHTSIIEVFSDAKVREVLSSERLNAVIAQTIGENVVRVEHAQIKSVDIGGQNVLATKFSLNHWNSVLMFWSVSGDQFKCIGSLYFPDYQMVFFNIISESGGDVLICTGLKNKNYPARMYCYELQKQAGTFLKELIGGFLDDLGTIESFACIPKGPIFATDGHKLAKVDFRKGTTEIIDEVREDDWLASKLFLWQTETSM